uniref:Protein kinase domain-containing protein n=1 Tax=Biomphalaria glabrata TaxID=6526 RepID=A0A2C9M4F9_BIOGL
MRAAPRLEKNKIPVLPREKSSIDEYKLGQYLLFKEKHYNVVSKTLIRKLQNGALDRVVSKVNVISVGNTQRTEFVIDVLIPSSCTGSLMSLMVNRKIEHTTEVCIALTVAVAEMLGKIHDSEFVYGELKLSNLFLDKSNGITKVNIRYILNAELNKMSNSSTASWNTCSFFSESLLSSTSTTTHTQSSSGFYSQEINVLNPSDSEDTEETEVKQTVNSSNEGITRKRKSVLGFFRKSIQPSKPTVEIVSLASVAENKYCSIESLQSRVSEMKVRNIRQCGDEPFSCRPINARSRSQIPHIVLPDLKKPCVKERPCDGEPRIPRRSLPPIPRNATPTADDESIVLNLQEEIDDFSPQSLAYMLSEMCTPEVTDYEDSANVNYRENYHVLDVNSSNYAYHTISSTKCDTLTTSPSDKDYYDSINEDSQSV